MVMSFAIPVKIFTCDTGVELNVYPITYCVGTVCDKLKFPTLKATDPEKLVTPEPGFAERVTCVVPETVTGDVGLVVGLIVPPRPVSAGVMVTAPLKPRFGIMFKL